VHAVVEVTTHATGQFLRESPLYLSTAEGTRNPCTLRASIRVGRTLAKFTAITFFSTAFLKFPTVHFTISCTNYGGLKPKNQIDTVLNGFVNSQSTGNII
jgi:hypothetical protein